MDPCRPRSVVLSLLAAIGASALPLRAQDAGAGPAPTARVEVDDRPAPELRWSRDLVYAERGGESLRLDLVRPAGGAERLPCVLAIHGGGWSSGNRGQMETVLNAAAKLGLAAATPSYRLLPGHPWPAARDDVFAARDWLAAHADELGLDPERFAAIGFSAGGHLALLLGLQEREPGRPAVRAVANFFGPTLLNADGLAAPPGGLVQSLLAGTPAQVPERYAEASPLTWVGPGDAAIYTYHGTADPIVPYRQSTRLHDALRAVPGLHAELVEKKDGQHGWARAEMRADVETALRSLRHELSGDAPAKLVLADDFEAEDSRWWFSDPAAWAWRREEGDGPANGWLEIVNKKSGYAPPHRSPLHLAIRKDVEVESFVLDLDLRTTHADYGHRDLTLVFGWQGPTRYYYVHLGQVADPNSHGVFLVDDAPRRRLDGLRQGGTPWGERWHRVRLVRNVDAGTIRVFFDDFSEPHLEAVDTTLGRGAIGFGSFDDTGRFDALRLRSITSEGR